MVYALCYDRNNYLNAKLGSENIVNSSVSIFIVLAALSGVLSVLLTIYSYVNRNRYSGIRLFFWISICSAIYSFGFSMELASTSLEEIMYWVKFEYLGMPFISPLSLALVMYYVGMEKYVTRRNIMLLLVIPALTFLFVLTNEYHHLFYQDVYLNPDAPSLMMDMNMGEWYIVHGSYTVSCILTGIFLLLRYWNRRKNVLRSQLIALFIGFALPWVAAFIYLMGLTPYQMDPVPLIMWITSFFYMWAIRTSGLLVASPVAREYIFDSMRDGVLVVDPQGFLADYNPAAEVMIPGLQAAFIARPVNQIRLTEDFDEEIFEFYPDSKLTHIKEVGWNIGHEACHYKIQSSPVINRRGQFVGRTYTVLDVTEQVRLEEELRRLATYDGLTDIYNRTYFMQESQRELEVANRNNRPFSLMMIDIDHFKRINDLFGHDTGDLALRHIASILKEWLANEYILGRYGGEEFVAALPGLDLREAALCAEELRREIERVPLNCAAGEIGITASFGVAESRLDGAPLESIFTEADKALYASKKNGRNRVSTAS